VDATGDITQKTGTTIAATSDTTLATTGNITLDSTTNDFGTINAKGTAITLADSNSLILGDVASTSSFAAAVGGSISQTGPMAVGGKADLQAPNGKIDLGNTGNKFGGLVSFKSPITIFAGAGAPSNALESAAIASALGAMAALRVPSASLLSQQYALATHQPEPVAANQAEIPNSASATNSASSASAPSSEPTNTALISTAAMPISVPGFQVVEVRSETFTKDPGAPTQLDTVIQLANAGKTSNAGPGSPKLFVIDGGIRLPNEEKRRALQEVR
jgi:hypothetical protein